MSRIAAFQSTGEAASPKDASPRLIRVALPLIILAAAALRMYRLGAQSLWVDEILTLKAASVGGELSLQQVFWNIQGPLHAAVTHFVARLSLSEVALRAPSAIAGVAAVPLVYLLGKDLKDRRTGLVAAALMAASPFAVWYSQEVRNYSFLIFFSAAATLAAWQVAAAHGRSFRLYAVGGTLALYSNLSAAFLLLAHNVFGLVRIVRRGLLDRWFVTYLVIGLLSVPLLLGLTRWVDVDRVVDRVVVAPLAQDEELLRGPTTFSPAAVPYSVYTMVYGYSLGPGTEELHTFAPATAMARHALLVVPAGLLALLGLAVGAWDLWRSGAAGRLVVSVVAVPFVAAAALALLNVKPFNVRYVAVMLPAVLVTLAAGVTRLGKWKGAVLAGLLGLLALVSLANYYYRPEYSREDVRAAARYVAAAEEPGDIVLVPVVRDVFTFYFEGEADHFVLYKGQTRSEEDLSARIGEAVRGRKRLWFVDSRLWHVDAPRNVPAFLETRYELLDRASFAGAAVSLYALD